MLYKYLNHFFNIIHDRLCFMSVDELCFHLSIFPEMQNLSTVHPFSLRPSVVTFYSEDFYKRDKLARIVGIL